MAKEISNERLNYYLGCIRMLLEAFEENAANQEWIEDKIAQIIMDIWMEALESATS